MFVSTPRRIIIKTEFNEISVRIPKVNALHRAACAMPYNDVGHERRVFFTKLPKRFLRVPLRRKAQIEAPRQRIFRRRQELRRARMDIDFLLAEIQRISSVLLLRAKPQQSPVKGKSFFKILRGQDDMVNGPDFHRVPLLSHFPAFSAFLFSYIFRSARFQPNFFLLYRKLTVQCKTIIKELRSNSPRVIFVFSVSLPGV